MRDNVSLFLIKLLVLVCLSYVLLELPYTERRGATCTYLQNDDEAKQKIIFLKERQ